MSQLPAFFLLTVLFFLVNGCDQQPSIPTTAAPPITQNPQPQPINDTIREAWNYYHIHGVDMLAQSVACLAQFKTHLSQLIQSPTPAHLDKTRSVLSDCQALYALTDLLIATSPEIQQQLDMMHNRIGQPLEMPGFIDSVESYPFSGIVNDASLVLSKDELIRQHGLTDTSDVSLGFSVIEFLLWGEHKKNKSLTPRSINDFNAINQWNEREYALGLGELDIKEHPNNRRRRYLELTTLILEQDLNQLATLWNKNTAPPLNLKQAERCKHLIHQKITQALNQSYHEPKQQTQILENIFGLFYDSESVTQITLSHWFELTDKEAFKDFSHDESLFNAKQKALINLLSENTP